MVYRFGSSYELERETFLKGHFFVGVGMDTANWYCEHADLISRGHYFSIRNFQTNFEAIGRRRRATTTVRRLIASSAVSELS